MKLKFLLLLIIISFSVLVYGEDKTIDELNPNFEGIIATATKAKPRFGDKYKYWTMFHFSDIHSDKREFSRLLEFYKKYEKYFDEIYCSGDQVMDNLEDDFTYWSNTPGHEKVLMCIGNHDVKKSPKSKVTDQISQKETYDFFYKPFIKNWNCEYEEGHTYYYKDYKVGVRLITVDCMLHGNDNNEQFIWFDKVIKDALNKKLSVIIINHCPLDYTIKIKSNFTQNVDFQSVYFNMEEFQKSVDSFIEKGGDFICWLGGHIHADSICYNKDHPKQLNILIDAANKEQCEFHSDVKRPINTRHEDLANAFIVNLSLHQIKLIRIGANVNTFLQDRNYITIDYKTFEIINQN